MSDDRPPHKLALTVRLEKPLTRAELERLARRVRQRHGGRRYTRTFIEYLLEGDREGAGAWATTHWAPDLKVRILGLRPSEEAAGRAAETPSGTEVLGRWRRQLPAGVITIYRTASGETYARTGSKDGSERTEKLRADGERRLVNAASPHGDFYRIDSRGDLQIHDREGLIGVARKIR